VKIHKKLKAKEDLAQGGTVVLWRVYTPCQTWSTFNATDSLLSHVSNGADIAVSVFKHLN